MIIKILNDWNTNITNTDYCTKIICFDNPNDYYLFEIFKYTLFVTSPLGAIHLADIYNKYYPNQRLFSSIEEAKDQVDKFIDRLPTYLIFQ